MSFRAFADFSATKRPLSKELAIAFQLHLTDECRDPDVAEAHVARCYHVR